jgi:hypothetical protein
MKNTVTAGFLLALAVLPMAKAEWYDDMKIKGDIRYRFENIEEEGKDNRQRDRIRARIGAFPRINNEMDVGIQLSTGEEKGNKTSPTSGNSTFTDAFSKKGIYLDLAYFAWHPELARGLVLTGGKMKNPFITVGDYIWDSDVTPEGLAANYKLGDDFELLANAGYFWLIERSAGDDNRLYAGQLALNFKPNDDTHFMGGCSYYRFDNIEGTAATDLDWQSNPSQGFGNTLNKVTTGSSTNFFYANDYGLIEPFVEVGFKFILPVTLYASYVVNNDADDDNTGYMAGINLGKAVEPRSFEVGYNYRRLEKDAALGALTDSDSWGGGTDGEGHKVFAKYQILKNWQAGITYFMDEKPLDDSHDYDRLQVDLMAKF